MKIIAHISDLHFGTEDPRIAEALYEDLASGSRASLIAISGDLTQRAKRGEFQKARAFLDRLHVPYIVVPGNHDVPLYNLASRFFDPYGRYKRAISEDLAPFYFDDTLAVAGINTAHGFTVKDGRITKQEAQLVRSRFLRFAEHWKIVVSHHPFVLPPDADKDDRVNGAEEVLPIFERAGVDLILSGHLHVASSSDAAHRNASRTIISVHAGTSISTRLRGEPNGYNRMVISGEEIVIVHRVWDGRAFIDGTAKAYRRHFEQNRSTATFERVMRA